MASSSPGLAIALWGPGKEQRAFWARLAGLDPVDEDEEAPLQWASLVPGVDYSTWLEIPGTWLVSLDSPLPTEWKQKAVAVFDSSMSPEMVISGLAAVAAGWTILAPNPPAQVSHLEALVVRERQVLELVAAGLPTKAIAFELALNEGTIKFHLGNIYKKLGVASRSQAVAEALRHGLISV